MQAMCYCKFTEFIFCRSIHSYLFQDMLFGCFTADFTEWRKIWEEPTGLQKRICAKKSRFHFLRREAAMVIDEYTNMEYVFDEEDKVNMCKGVQGMIDDAVEEAMKDAMEKENTALVENIKNLMKNMNWTAEEAMDALGMKDEKKQIVRETMKKEASTPLKNT